MVNTTNFVKNRADQLKRARENINKKKIPRDDSGSDPSFSPEKSPVKKKTEISYEMRNIPCFYMSGSK